MNYNERLRLAVLVMLRAGEQTDWDNRRSIKKQADRMPRLSMIVQNYEKKASITTAHLTFSYDEAELIKNAVKRS